MAASMKCGGGHWNKAGSKLFRAITIARAAQLACVKNNLGREHLLLAGLPAHSALPPDADIGRSIHLEA